jgi:pentatricopeptide repeat protein
MSTLLNAANLNLGIFNNYMTDVAVGVLFGLGYYLVKTIRKRGGDENQSSTQSDSKLKSAVKSRLENALERWSYAKSIEEYHELIKTNYQSCDPYEILNLIQSKGLSPSIDTYNALLLNCFHNGNFSSASILKEEILDTAGPVIPNNYTLNILIKGLSLQYRNKRDNKSFDEELEKLLNLLQDRGVVMDIIAHNTIIDALIDQERLSEAFDKYFYLKRNKDRLNIQFDYYTFTSLLKGIRLTPGLNDSWLEKAFLLLDEVKSTPSVPQVDESFYNSLLDTCVKFNKIDKAEKLFKTILSLFPQAKEYTYSIMIKAYAKIFKVQKSLEMFEMLEKSGNSLSTISLGCIINACMRCGETVKAEKFYSYMKEKNIPMNAYIYSTMIKGYSKSKNFEKAYEIYQNVISLSNPQNMTIVFFNSILDCCVQTENYEKMNQIYEYLKNLCTEEKEGESNLSQLQPDIISYSIVLKGYAKNNNIEKVLDLYNFISENPNLQFDEVLFNTILDCFARNNDEKSLKKFYNDMKNNKIPQSVITYGVLLKLYANLGNVEKSNEIFNKMIHKGITPSVITFQIMIRLYSHQNMPHKAISIFRKMLNMNITPDHIIYEAIIKVAYNNFFTREAGEFINLAFNQGIKISDYIYEQFVGRVIHDNKMKLQEKKSTLTELYSKLKSQELELSTKALNDISKFLYNQIIKEQKQSQRNQIQKKEQNLNVNFYEAKSIYA